MSIEVRFVVTRLGEFHNYGNDLTLDRFTDAVS